MMRIIFEIDSISGRVVVFTDSVTESKTMFSGDIYNCGKHAFKYVNLEQLGLQHLREKENHGTKTRC